MLFQTEVGVTLCTQKKQKMGMRMYQNQNGDTNAKPQST